MNKITLSFIPFLLHCGSLVAQCNGPACTSLSIVRPPHDPNHTYLNNNDNSRVIHVNYTTPANYGTVNKHSVDVQPKKGATVEGNAGNFNATFVGGQQNQQNQQNPCSGYVPGHLSWSKQIATDEDLPTQGGYVRFKAGTTVYYWACKIIQGTLANDQDIWTGYARVQWRGGNVVKFNGDNGKVLEGVLNVDTQIPDKNGQLIWVTAGTKVVLGINGYLTN